MISRPDPQKGEQLIAVTTDPQLPLDEVQAALRARGFRVLSAGEGVTTLRTISSHGPTGGRAPGASGSRRARLEPLGPRNACLILRSSPEW